MNLSRWMIGAGVLWLAVGLTLAAEPGEGVPKPGAKPMTTYLGVATSPVDDTLARHLDLSDDVGLVVDYVDPDSPAGGVLQPHDVLRRLNEQILVNHEQLAVLVRGFKSGQQVTLDIIRKGKAETVTVKLAEREQAPLQRRAWKTPAIPWAIPGGGGFDEEWPGKVVEQFRDMLQHSGMGDEQIGDILGKFQRDSKSAPTPPAPPSAGKPEGAAPPGESSRSLRACVASMIDGYAVTLTTDGEGRHQLKVVDAAGKTVFDGPLNTPDDREKVPAAVKDKLKDIERMSQDLIEKGAWGRASPL